MRACFIHIGTHKTGTTSLQVTLNRHHSDLETLGYVYPRTGRPPEAPDGHHNIAWEIADDRRFQKKYGTLDDLITEVRRVPHNVILSREDFECSIHHRERFQEFIRRLQSCQLAVKIVVYFRNRVDYSQRLYLTMLNFGIVESSNQFLEEILRSGQFRWRDWIFPFCYKDLLTRLQAIKEIDVIVRSYDRPNDRSLIVDYLSIFGLDPTEVGIDTNIRTNVRSDIMNSVRLFCQNRKGAPLDRNEDQIIASLFAPLKDKSLDISNRSKRRIVERFRDSNEYVALRYEDVEFLKHPDVSLDRVDETLWMETVFSSDLQHQIDGMATTFRAEHDVIVRGRDQLSVECHRLAGARRSWALAGRR